MGRLTRRYRIWYRDWWAKRSSRQDWTTEQWCDSNFTATLQCRDPSMVLARNAVDIARCIPISTPDDGRPPHVVPQVMHEDRLYNLASRLIGLMGRAETKIAAVHLYKILKWTQVHIDEGRKEYVSGMEARMANALIPPSYPAQTILHLAHGTRLSKRHGNQTLDFHSPQLAKDESMESSQEVGDAHRSIRHSGTDRIVTNESYDRRSPEVRRGDMIMSVVAIVPTASSFYSCDCGSRVFFETLGPPWRTHSCYPGEDLYARGGRAPRSCRAGATGACAEHEGAVHRTRLGSQGNCFSRRPPHSQDRPGAVPASDDRGRGAGGAGRVQRVQGVPLLGRSHGPGDSGASLRADRWARSRCTHRPRPVATTFARSTPHGCPYSVFGDPKLFGARLSKPNSKRLSCPTAQGVWFCCRLEVL